MSSAARIVVTGLIAQYPLGGVTWDYLQYATGLARLGHDVYYVEDTGQWPFNPAEGGVSETCDLNVRYLSDVMGGAGLADRWAYRFPWESQWYGLDDATRTRVLATADLVVNVSGVLRDPRSLAPSATLAFVDSDPVFTQIKLLRGQHDLRQHVDAHDVHFTFGETLSSSGFYGTGHDWLPTRQPVVLDEWRNDAEVRDALTTVMNWTSYKPVTWDGRAFGQKDVEFERFLDLPARVPQISLEAAVNAGKTRRTPYDLLRHHGWTIVDPDVVCPDAASYRAYIQRSKGEWSVAKNGYVEGRSGWFSCRSACYLAAGRPVVLQDTGFSDVLPVGEGIVAFTDLDGAAAAIHAVVDDYDAHSQAATEIASEHFRAERVLGRLVDEALR